MNFNISAVEIICFDSFSGLSCISSNALNPAPASMVGAPLIRVMSPLMGVRRMESGHAAIWVMPLTRLTSIAVRRKRTSFSRFVAYSFLLSANGVPRRESRATGRVKRKQAAINRLRVP